MPIGIQRKRTKGWRMPTGAVSVTRPGRYGNPFRVGIFGTAAECVDAFDLCISEFPVPQDRIERWRTAGGNVTDLIGLASGVYLKDIRGRDLACFCGLDQPCHRNPLMQRANSDIVSR